MVRRLWFLVVLVAAAACVAESPPEPEAERPALPGTLVPATEPAATTSTSTSMASDAVRLDVLANPTIPIGRRLEQLGIFGYRVRPSTSAGRLELPDLDDLVTAAEIHLFDVNWGIDSSAVLLAVEGDVGPVEDRLRGTTRWLLAGDERLVALYKGGLAAGFEMDDLVEVVAWVMDPDAACDRFEPACPAGPDVGFPPPPPSLVVNGPLSTDAPFEVIEVSDASSISNDAGTLTVVDDGEVVTGLGDAAQRRGASRIAHSFGSFVFAVATGADGTDETIELWPCCDPNNTRAWSIPLGWMVEGLTVTGNFGQGDYQLIVVADRDDGSGVAVGMPLGERLFDPDADADVGPAASVEQRPMLHRPDRRWSLPQRSDAGGLLVVEQREDGWYLIDDALDSGRDLVRSSHPIMDYAVAIGGAHIAIIVDGPGGPSTWWINGGDVAQLDGSPTTLGWFGTHRVRG